MKGHLLDTHIILWLASKPEKLTNRAKNILLSPQASLFVSIASAWEVAIKLSLNKLTLEGGVATFFEICSTNGIQVLNINEQHLSALSDLPFIHRDPFDRLLIATAKIEGLTLITADSSIQKYQANWIW